MVSHDAFDAASKIVQALDALSESEVKRAVLMALIFLDKSHLLVDPKELDFRTVRPKEYK